MLGDLLAAAANPNVGSWRLAPAATEIEAQTVRWIADLIGFPAPSGGLLVSGGNMANVVGFIAARAAAATWDVRKEGTTGRVVPELGEPTVREVIHGAYRRSRTDERHRVLTWRRPQ